MLSVVTAAQVTLRPGQYEYTIDMKLAGAPKEAGQAVLDAAGLKGQKKLECITPDEARQAKENAVSFFTKEMVEDQNCKVSDAKVSGNTLTFSTTCVEDGEKTTIHSATTFARRFFHQHRHDEGRRRPDLHDVDLGEASWRLQMTVVPAATRAERASRATAGTQLDCWVATTWTSRQSAAETRSAGFAGL
jgi:hypothetical protein